MQTRTLYPKVVVYENAIPSPAKWIKTIEQDADWFRWYDVGEQYSLSVSNDEAKIWTTMPSYKEVVEWINGLNLRKQLFQENLLAVYKIFLEVINDYLKKYPIEFKNLYTSGFDILRYKAKTDQQITTLAGGSDIFALPFHTDRDQRTEDEPGNKAVLTVTMYLNDDYEGGDINYAIFDGTYADFTTNGNQIQSIEDANKEIDHFVYKPTAGDVIIFPSTIPYYHGVNKVTKGEKYVIRCHFNEYRV